LMNQQPIACRVQHHHGGAPVQQIAGSHFAAQRSANHNVGFVNDWDGRFSVHRNNTTFIHTTVIW
jgi:hypothetical protein